MKTIQIPTTSNPFIVNINNNEYQYRAGETAEVPDEVAEAIEDALELVPKPKKPISENCLPSYIDGRLTEITEKMLEGAMKIEPYMFANSKIVSIEIPKSVERIEKYAFYNCRSLKSVTIPDVVTELSDEMFFNCKALTSFVVPTTVKNIGTSVFANCNNLTKVYLPETPPTLADINTFSTVNADCKFYCKSQASADAYKAAANWSTLAGTYSFVVEA